MTLLIKTSFGYLTSVKKLSALSYSPKISISLKLSLNFLRKSKGKRNLPFTSSLPNISVCSNPTNFKSFTTFPHASEKDGDILQYIKCSYVPAFPPSNLYKSSFIIISSLQFSQINTTLYLSSKLSHNILYTFI